jgi:raffinose/stachyose/melibiose transport system permease protein
MILLICIPVNVTIIKLIPILKSIGLLNTRLGASLIYADKTIPVAVFLYTGFMRTLPKELYESAIVEGSGIFQTYRLIYMPLMKTITGSVVIFSSTTVWNDFLVSIVTLGSVKISTLVPRLYALNSATFTRWDLVFASSILVSLPVIVLYVLLQRAFERGLLSGALKG